MNGLALFAGVGGLELAVSLAVPSFRCLGYVELDSFCASVLVARMEGSTLDQAPIFDDVREFDGEPYRGRVDLVLGGFPCQDVSAANHAGEGLDGARSRLWDEFSRIALREIRPRFVFVENVPNIVIRRPGLDRILADFAECGFDAEWDVFSADRIGAPMLRRRFFLLARRISDPDREILRVEPERGNRRTQTTDKRNALSRTMGEPMGDPDRGRSKGERVEELGGLGGERGAEPNGSDFDRRFLWPPGPDDLEGWRDYVGAGFPPPSVGGFRRGVNGIPPEMDDLSDRLRSLGNGVCPLAGAYAFRTLADRLGVDLG